MAPEKEAHLPCSPLCLQKNKQQTNSFQDWSPAPGPTTFPWMNKSVPLDLLFKCHIHPMPQLARYFLQVSILELILKNTREGACKCISLSQCTMSNMPVKPLFEKVKIRNLILAPLFNNSTDCGGAGRSSNFFFLHLKQRQCRTQKDDGSAYSLPSTGWICESGKCFYL